MRVLLIGRTGQLARELACAEWPVEWRPEFAGRERINLAGPEQAVAAAAERDPDLIINAAGYTAVDRAESEPDVAMRINAESPAAIAAECARRNIPFVTLSTDYVFDGSKAGPYTEEDDIKPASAYGRSKAEGEGRVRAAHEWHLILRTSWVFSAHGTNFVKTMLRVGAERDSISVVSDQRGKPTAASDLARAIIAASVALVQNQALAGTYHVANADATTWHDFARAIFDGARVRGAPTPQLRAIATADYPTAAHRPANSVLATEKFERTFGHRFRPWRAPLAEVLDELLPPSAASQA
jgi:dTDP-4-dehydrorhamnose reductase